MSKINLSYFSEEEVTNLLPHGSGFNGNWETELKDGFFIGEMVYDHMNEDGMYDFIVPFSVKIPLDDALSFEVELAGSDEQNQLAEDDDLPSYFEDTIAEAIQYGYSQSIIDALLRKYDANFTTSKENGVKVYSLVEDNDEPWGTITVRNGKAYFIHSNEEPEIALSDVKLPAWVKAYTEGFDYFAEVVDA